MPAAASEEEAASGGRSDIQELHTGDIQASEDTPAEAAARLAKGKGVAKLC